MAKVLVVDDEAGVRRLTCKILKRAGHDVLQAEDGAAAYDVVRKRGGALDLVITDIRMPRMSGTELADRLRSEYPHVKTMFMSAFSESAPEVSWDFVPKPFTPAMLLVIVERLVGQTTKKAPVGMTEGSAARVHWPRTLVAGAPSR